MALTATLATPLSTVPAGYLMNVHITVSNSGSSAVTIKQIRPQIKSTPIPFSEDRSSFTAAIPGAGGIQVPASGSQQVSMQLAFHGSNNVGSYDVQNPNGTTYDVSCIIYGADGSVFSPTPLLITVTQNNQGN